MFTSTMHHITRVKIELYGLRATTESYYCAWHRLDGSFHKAANFLGHSYAESCQRDGVLAHGHDIICAGRYFDLLLIPPPPAGYSGDDRLTPIRLPPRHHGLDNSGNLVGQSHRRQQARVALQQL
jgi:hypothetical protein